MLDFLTFEACLIGLSALLLFGVYAVIGMFAMLAVERFQHRELYRRMDESVRLVWFLWAVWPVFCLAVLLYWLVKRPQPYQPPHYL